jgi:hypothetical protein
MREQEEDNVFLASLARLLRPVLQFTLRHHLKHAEIAEVLRRELVSLAIEELEAKGERWNTSRLSVMTGLHRSEVERIVVKTDLVPKRVHFLNRLIGRWQSDPRFCTARGAAKVLPESGEEGSFRALVSEVSLELNPSTVLFELERSGLVVRKGGKVSLQRKAFIPHANTEQVFQLVGNDIGALLQAAEENLEGDAERAHLHLTTSFDNIDPEEAGRIKRWVIAEGFRFHERVRKFLARYDRDTGGAESNTDEERKRHEFSITTFSFDTSKDQRERT